MAIKFFDDITLDKQEIQQVSLEKLGTEPTAPGALSYEGRIIYTQDTNTMKYFDGTDWVELTGGATGVTSFTNTNGSFVSAGTTNSSATGAVTMGVIDLSAGGTPTAANFLRGDNTWATPAGGGSMSDWILNGDSGSVTITDNDTVSIEGDSTAITTLAAATDTLTVSHDTFGTAGTYAYPEEIITNTTGHITSVTAGTAPTNYTLPTVAAGANSARIELTASPSTVVSSVTFAGTTNEIAITETTSTTGTITVGLPDDVTIAGELTVAGTGQSSFGGQVTVETTPLASTDAASKAYVDSVVAGGLIYQGGYNASTDETSGGDSLDGTSGTSLAVTKGWTYTVTTAGSFFTEAVEVGDVLIAEIDMASGASALADWTTVQNNIGIATAAATDAAADKGISGYSSAYFDVSSDGWVETNTGHVASVGGATSIVVNHALGTRDVIVQLYDDTSYDTVYAKVVRTDINNVTLTFSTAPGAGNIRCVITAISNVL